MAIELVDGNGFIRPSKSPADTPRQAGKGLILPEDFCWLTLALFFTFSSADTCLKNFYGCKSFTDN